ncbi:UPF0182 family membrane protein [Microbacterium halophytorum]|uniref:UPF0182 family membrane protein n=1 Tax=Microbacterium halophytorum TaxID=2067568 RepID=UPI000CFCEB1F|nr:UPF0182 family protein [Microbacterium halophytorum]
MTSTTAPTPKSPPSPVRRVITIAVIVIAALVAAFFVFASLYADVLWFEQLGFAGVMWTQWGARALMFVIGFVAMAVPLWLSISLAHRLRPVYAQLSSQLDRYQEVIEPLRRLATWGIPIFFGLFAGFSASSSWETAALWINGGEVGEVDPEFGHDLGFYMFDLPFYAGVVAFASAVVLLSLVLTIVVSYLYGSVRIGQGELRISKAARFQIAIIAALYLLLQGVSLWLDRYAKLTEAGDRITGPGYVGTHAEIPGLTILAIVAILVAALFVVTAFIGRWRLPLIGTGLLIVTALVVNVAYPAIINTLQVQPNQYAYESDYYQRNVDGTREAYGIDDIEVESYAAETATEAGQLGDDLATTTSLRLMDPAVISPTVRQLQQHFPYYSFEQTLDVDRYEVDGETQDTVVSVRELNQSNLDSQTWQNTAMVYTHGYGLVAAKGNARTTDGWPVFLESGIPTTGIFSDMEYEPRVYFGENSPEYSIVGQPEGEEPLELDYARGEDGSSETRTTFTGEGGPSVGNLFNQLIYALKFQSEQIFLSEYVNEESQILYDRHPVTRVQKVAPYLTVDSDPYPTVVDGRVKWVVDGYTTSADYPYSTPVGLGDAISDSNVPQPQVRLDEINYIRNSVKATVDAYDGSVTLYAWDDQDPVLQAWQKVYPSTLEPISEMSGELMSHVRYPTDLFKVQREMLGVYHVDNAASFYQRDNVWNTPNDPQNDQVKQPPYYLTMQMPTQDDPSYSLYTTFIPPGEGEDSRNVLLGYLAADSDAGSTAGEVREDYGTLRLLQISSDTTVAGPGQVQNTFDSDPSIAEERNILQLGDSELALGNLLTVPVGGGFLYVQPVYVQSTAGTSYPLLQRVFVSFGDKLAFTDTLADGLDQIFGGDSGAETGDSDVEADPDEAEDQPTPDTGEADQPDDSEQPEPDTGGTGVEGTEAYQEALAAAQSALQERNDAISSGDQVAIAEANEKLGDAVETLLELEGDTP